MQEILHGIFGNKMIADNHHSVQDGCRERGQRGDEEWRWEAMEKPSECVGM